MGETILGNRYEIIRKIGDGGMAFVYEAKDRLLNRTVAVKVLRPEFVDDDEFLGKFKREAEAVASLSHSNIVNVYDVGEEGKVHYIVMEFIDGQNLKDIIKNEGTLDEYTALDIIKQIAMALGAAHKKGIVHRDIKPHNILISNEDRIVKVADFGIAKAVSNSTMTNVGSIIGSVHYFSPEQAKGKFVSSNADLYSLGIVLYEMLIGKVPFTGDSPIAIALQHINDDIEFTSEEKVRIPQSVRTIIKKLTEKSTVERYQSAEEVIEDIEYIERNIDLDFIKEYDNYATQKIDEKELNKSVKQITKPQSVDLDDDSEENFVEEKIKPKRNDKKKRNVKKEAKEDSPLVKKFLIAAAIILTLVLSGQVFLAFKFIGGGNNGDIQTVVAPDIENIHFDEAQKELKKLGLKITLKEEYSSTVEKNYVISQTPMAGTEVLEGDTITIVLSMGTMESEIPNIVGLSLGEAENVLKENKLSLGNIKYEHSESFAKGEVISQTPKSGETNSGEGQKVDVIVSKGPQQVAPPKEEVVSPPTTETPDEEGSTPPPTTETPDGGGTPPTTETPDGGGTPPTTETPDGGGTPPTTETPDGGGTPPTTETPDGGGTTPQSSIGSPSEENN